MGGDGRPPLDIYPGKQSVGLSPRFRGFDVNILRLTRVPRQWSILLRSGEGLRGAGGGAVTAVNEKNMQIPHDFNEALFVRTLIIIYILASNGGYRGAVVNLAFG